MTAIAGTSNGFMMQQQSNATAAVAAAADAATAGHSSAVMEMAAKKRSADNDLFHMVYLKCWRNAASICICCLCSFVFAFGVHLV